MNVLVLGHGHMYVCGVVERHPPAWCVRKPTHIHTPTTTAALRVAKRVAVIEALRRLLQVHTHLIGCCTSIYY